MSDRIIARLDALAAAEPDAPALTSTAARATRRELQARSSAIGRALLDRGVRPGDAVAVEIARSFDSVAAILGVLRAGAAWVPIDPAHPEERRRWIADDAEVRATLASGAASRSDVIDVRALPADAAPLCVAGRERLNLIYTSGSTGRPKGVIGTHAAMLNRVAWAHEALPYAPGEVQAHRSAPGFVDAGPELLGGLLAGVPVAVIAPEEQADLARFVAAARSLAVTRMTVVPSLLTALLRAAPDLAARLPALRLWITSGEELTAGLLRRFREALPDATLINLYGTTEVTGDVTAARFDPGAPLPEGRVPIGLPIAGATLTALDADGRPAPDGEAGELVVGGPALAAGYHRAPQEQGHRFPTLPGLGRVFRTGDRARRLPDGAYEYLGRTDHLVKVSGVRIELGEVERALETPGIELAVVLHGSQLVAVVVDPDAQPGPPVPAPPPVAEALQARAAARLPEVMRPTAVHAARALPLSPNGKLDRRALVGWLDGARREVPHADRPRPGAELALAAIWAEILGLPGPEAIARTDRFAELGGGSLGLAELALALANLPGAAAVPLEAARTVTLAELAGALDGGALTSTAGPRVSLTPVVPDDEVIALLVEAAADRTIQIATELPWNLDHDAARRYAAEADGVVIRVDGRAAGAAFIQLHPNIGDGVEVPPGAVQLDEWLLAPYRDLGLLGAAGAWPLLRAWMAERFRHEVSVVWEDHTTMITILRARGYRRLGRVWWRSASDGDGTEGPCEVWLYDLRG